jgi:hypothetical protein
VVQLVHCRLHAGLRRLLDGDDLIQLGHYFTSVEFGASPGSRTLSCQVKSLLCYRNTCEALEPSHPLRMNHPFQQCLWHPDT